MLLIEHILLSNKNVLRELKENQSKELFLSDKSICGLMILKEISPKTGVNKAEYVKYVFLCLDSFVRNFQVKTNFKLITLFIDNFLFNKQFFAITCINKVFLLKCPMFLSLLFSSKSI